MVETTSFLVNWSEWVADCAGCGWPDCARLGSLERHFDRPWICFRVVFFIWLYFHLNLVKFTGSQ